jgi:hypothetical protein
MNINIYQIIKKIIRGISFFKKSQKLEDEIKKTYKQKIKRFKHKGCFGKCKNKPGVRK